MGWKPVNMLPGADAAYFDGHRHADDEWLHRSDQYANALHRSPSQPFTRLYCKYDGQRVAERPADAYMAKPINANQYRDLIYLYWAACIFVKTSGRKAHQRRMAKCKVLRLQTRSASADALNATADNRVTACTCTALRLDIKMVSRYAANVVSKRTNIPGTASKLVCCHSMETDWSSTGWIIHILLLIQTVVVAIFTAVVPYSLRRTYAVPLSLRKRRSGAEKQTTAVIAGNADRFVPVINHSARQNWQTWSCIGQVFSSGRTLHILSNHPPPLPEKPGCHHRPCEYNSAAPSSP